MSIDSELSSLSIDTGLVKFGEILIEFVRQKLFVWFIQKSGPICKIFNPAWRSSYYFFFSLNWTPSSTCEHSDLDHLQFAPNSWSLFLVVRKIWVEVILMLCQREIPMAVAFLKNARPSGVFSGWTILRIFLGIWVSGMERACKITKMPRFFYLSRDFRWFLILDFPKNLGI